MCFHCNYDRDTCTQSVFVGEGRQHVETSILGECVSNDIEDAEVCESSAQPQHVDCLEVAEMCNVLVQVNSRLLEGSELQLGGLILPFDVGV